MNKLQEKLRQLDIQIRRNMIGLKPIHHSTGDWNFRDTNWELNSSIYVSTPSSLHFLGYNSNALVKITTVPIANVKEGRIITYVRSSAANARSEIVFRYQDNDNYYTILMRCTNAFETKIIRIYGGVQTTLKESKVINWLPANTWVRIRVTWWNDYVGLVIRLEYWTGSTWANIMDDTYDSSNYWQTIGGRIGIGSFAIGTGSDYYYFDDTEIYGIS